MGHFYRFIAVVITGALSWALVVALPSFSHYTAGFLQENTVNNPLENVQNEPEEYEEDIPDTPRALSAAIVEHNDIDHDDEMDIRYESLLLPDQEIQLKETQKEPEEENVDEKEQPVIEEISKEDQLLEQENIAQKEQIQATSGQGGGSAVGYKKGDVLFWEVAWMGVTADGSEEWIELYNSSTQEILLEGFTIEKGHGTLLVGESGDTFTTHHGISPGGYFVLRRTPDDIQSPSSKAYDGSLSNSGETLILKDALGNEIDRLAMADGWRAGSNTPTPDSYKPTMSVIDGQWVDGVPTPGFSNKAVPLKVTQEVLPLSYASSTIIISEVAWMGNASSSASEWIELVNNTSSPITLEGWSLSIETQSASSTIMLQGSIEGFGYFLMERTDDQSVPDAVADMFYAGALSNEGARLVLRDPWGASIDEVGMLESPWVAGDNTTKKTMQKDERGWFSASATPRSPNARDLEPVSLPEQEQSSPSILINEIAWMGTTASSAHEWIELYNASSSDISLVGWTLQTRSSASSSPETLVLFGEEDVLIAGGFLVLERSSSSTLPMIEGKIYSGGQLHNSGEYVELINEAGNAVDVVDALDGWPGGSNSTSPELRRASMERSANKKSWKTFNGLPNPEIVDAQGNPINGTPGQQNSL